MMNNNKKKTALLQASNDTCFQNNLNQNLSVIEDIGFKLLCSGNILNTNDKWRIFWNDGLLLFCDSYYGDKKLNGGTVYFNYCGPREALDHCSSGFAGEFNREMVWDGDRDIREGLRYSINKMKKQGQILSTWIKRPFLWLLHYEDIKQNYDYKTINEERIALLPIEVQEAIKGQ